MKFPKKKIDKIPRSYLLALSGIIAIFVLVSIFILFPLWGGIQQPIAFNHKLHAENDLECLDCHPYYEEQAFSGKPSLETCSTCHEEPQGESPEEKKLIDFIESGKEIEWKRLYEIPEDVYFSHRRHVSLGNIECSACHGDIGESLKPPSKSVEMSMGRCMKCHEEKGADNDCIACHR